MILKRLNLVLIMMAVVANIIAQDTIPTIKYIRSESGKYGLADQNNKMLVDTVYDGDWYASLNQELGQAMFKKGKYWLLINYKNEIIIDLTGYSGHTNCFIRGMIPATDDKTGKAGYLNTKGEKVIPFIFENTNPFKKDLPYASASFNGKWGVIDEQGKWVLQPKYEHVYDIISNNSFIVMIKDEYYYVNANGKIISKAPVGD
jgi:hypothetical protein